CKSNHVRHRSHHHRNLVPIKPHLTHGLRCLRKTLVRMHDALWPRSGTGCVEDGSNLIGGDLRASEASTRRQQKIVKGTHLSICRVTRQVTKLKRIDRWTGTRQVFIEFRLADITYRSAVAKNVIDLQSLQSRVDGYGNPARLHASDVTQSEFG